MVLDARKTFSLIFLLSLSCPKKIEHKPVIPEIVSVESRPGYIWEVPIESLSFTPVKELPYPLNRWRKPPPLIEIGLKGPPIYEEYSLKRGSTSIFKKEEEKPISIPERVPAPSLMGGIIQKIWLDKDTYQQGEPATLAIVSILPLENPKVRCLGNLYKLYPVKIERDRCLYGTFVAIDMDTKPGNYYLTLYYNESGRRKNLKLPFKVISAEFTKKDTVKLDIPTLTEETHDMLRYEHKYFYQAYRVNPDDIIPTKNFIWPAKGLVTSTFGRARKYGRELAKWRHKAIDIANVVGTPVVACGDGVVAMAKELDVHGKTIVIAHGGGVHSVYLHLSKILVKKGDRVKKGQIIGRLGRTGLCTGPNLHWQVMVGGVATDPRWWVKGGTEIHYHSYIK